MKIVQGLPPRTRYGIAAIDTELFGLRASQLHRPAGRLACLSISMDGKSAYLIEHETEVEKALHRIDGCRWIFHNAAFDVRHLRRWAEIAPRSAELLTDTLIVDKILWGGYYDRFRLQDLARRYLSIRLSKEARELFADSESSEVTDEMRQYAARDVITTWRIAKAQERFLHDDIQSATVWSEIDCPALWAVLDFKGFMLDTKKWAALADHFANEAKRLQAELKFNPNSWRQVKSALERRGIQIPNTQESTLLAYADRYKIIKKILAVRHATKRAGTYGQNVLDENVEADGRIYAEFNIIGASTGRMSSSSPNLQNIPKESAYRSCFRAAPGHSLVDADFHQQEPRITAVLSHDQALLEAIENGEDLHQTVADAIQSITGKSDRNLGKAINLASSYGITEFGLARQTGLTVPQAKELLNAYFRRFWGIERWIRAQRTNAQRDEYTRTLSGRRMWLNLWSRQSENNALNSPVQGSAADMIKRALALLHRHYGSRLPVVAVVHDEIILEVPRSKAATAKGQAIRAMEAAFRYVAPEAPLKNCVEVHIGKTWASKDD